MSFVASQSKRSTLFGVASLVIAASCAIRYFTFPEIFRLALPLSLLGVALGITAIVLSPRHAWLGVLAIISNLPVLAHSFLVYAMGGHC